jgi:methionyl-tRNA formyltransferase
MSTDAANPGPRDQLSGLRIIFMGTPEFAVPSLDKLLNAGCQIIAVITAPDRPGGRGLKIMESAVKKYALKKSLPVLQPKSLKDPTFLHQLESLGADLQVVVAFRMLPDAVWNMPRLGTINLHGSLLPQYRGAAPINWAVINGEQQTGVTTFKIQHEIDTGHILLQETIPIAASETAGEVHDRMKQIGADLLVKTVRGIAQGTLIERPQPAQSGVAGQESAPLKLAPKITTQICKIDWNQSIESVYNLIRGLAPFPGAFTSFEGKTMKVFRSRMEPSSQRLSPGTYQTDKKSYLKFACADGYIYLEEVQLEGRMKLRIEDFIRGYRFS